MNNALIEYADRLQQEHGHELGFLPWEAYRQAIKNDRLTPILNPSHNWIGFLLHGPPRPGSFTRVYQICVEPSWRRHYHGTDKVISLEAIAEKNNSHWVTLRCAADLPALLFWKSLGAKELMRRPGSPKTGRTLVELAIPVTDEAKKGLVPVPQPPRLLHPNVPNKLLEWLEVEHDTKLLDVKTRLGTSIPIGFLSR